MLDAMEDLWNLHLHILLNTAQSTRKTILTFQAQTALITYARKTESTVQMLLLILTMNQENPEYITPLMEPPNNSFMPSTNLLSQLLFKPTLQFSDLTEKVFLTTLMKLLKINASRVSLITELQL